MNALTKHLPQWLKLRARRLLDLFGDWPQEIQDGPARGLTIVAPFSRRYSYCYGKYEPHVMTTLSKVVQPGMVVCDMGCHLGYFTLALAQLVGTSGHVYAFEPLPRHARSLHRSMTHNRLAQVTVVTQAVGDRTGLATLEEWQNSSMTRIADSNPTRWGIRRLQIQMATLDDWVAQEQLERLDLIKLDVEGQELAALRGASKALSCYRPHIICEIHRRGDVPYQPHEIIAWLRRAGYEVALIPNPARPDETLHAAIVRLETAQLPPGWMAAAHVLATAIY